MRKLIVVNIIVGILVSCGSSNEKKDKSVSRPKSPEVKKEVVTIKKYEDQKGRFRIDFPCNEVIKDSTFINEHKVVFFYCETNVDKPNHMAYTLSFYDLLMPKEHSLEEEVAVSAESTSSKVLDVKDIKKMGGVGKEVKFIGSDFLSKALIIRIKERVYKLQVSVPLPNGENKEMYDFLNSFEIID